jgi:DNA modification methylase
VSEIIIGDCLEVLRGMKDSSIDSCVTDPPYGLEFMGKEWDAPWKSDTRQQFDGTLQDSDANPFRRSKVRNGNGRSYGADEKHMRAFQEYMTPLFQEVLRVLKPGGHLLSFGGSRTYHRMACAVEDAGFEIRDQIMWVYGQGFPKSLDVSKAIDKAAGAEREKVPATGGLHKNKRLNDDNWCKIGDASATMDSNAPATDAARQWQGWGTALKPAHEPIVVARKPLTGTVAANVLEWGTGGLNIDGCRIVFSGDGDAESAKPGGRITSRSGSLAGKSQDGFVISGPLDYEGERLFWSNDLGWVSRTLASVFYDEDIADPLEATGREPATQRREFTSGQSTLGRFPANLIHDGSDEVFAAFPDAPGQIAKSVEDGAEQGNRTHGKMKRGGPSHEPRNESTKSAARFFYCAKASKKDRGQGNNHPTVKPTELMRYLCRLVTPPGGIILDPFFGSGTTGVAASLEGFQFIGIEKNAEYAEIAKQRTGQ